MIELVKADLQHCRYLYDLYANPEVMAAHGRKTPVPAADWRRLIEGVWDGWRDVWVVRRGDALVGHAGLQDRVDLDRRSDVVVTIDPSCRGNGVGREVLAKVVERCDAQGIDTLISRVMFGNEASLSLFSGFGFREVGRIPRYYRTGDGVFSQIILVRSRPGADRAGKIDLGAASSGAVDEPTPTVAATPKPVARAEILERATPKPAKVVLRSKKAKARVKAKGVKRRVKR